MRLLLINHNGDLYGASRSLLRLAARLTADGQAVLVLAPEEGALVTALRRQGVAVRIEPRIVSIERRAFRSPLGLVRLLARIPGSVTRLRRVIRDFRPDVVHSNCSVILTPALAARLSGVPHIWHVREHYGDFPVFWRLYRRYLLALGRRVICVSGAMAEQFPAARRERQVVALHNGFPAAEFQPVPPARVAAFRRQYGVEQGRLAGVLGRIKLLRKGQETFVAAAGLLRERLPDARFLIIGAPFAGNEHHRAELERQAEALGVGDRVVFTGEVADVPAAYAALDVVVLPSGQPEPFGGVVIEAMAMGKPVVGTALGGTVEQIADGVTGLLAPPGDPAALAAALGALLADEPRRLEMGRQARARFLERFEFEPFYRRMLEVYADSMR